MHVFVLNQPAQDRVFIYAYWCNTGHVYEAVVQPRKPAHHPPSSLRCVSVRPQQSPSRLGLTTEMAAKVCRSVLLLSRSSGAVAGSLPALVVSSHGHHQHIRPVSPRTCGAHGHREAERERERGRGVGPGGQGGRREAGRGGKAAVGLAKEVKLTSLKIFRSRLFH